MKYEITYDYSDDWADCFNQREIFCGETWDELQEEIERLKAEGCYHIYVAGIEDEETIE